MINRIFCDEAIVECQSKPIVPSFPESAKFCAEPPRRDSKEGRFVRIPIARR